ncbi:42508_t:CDS:2, partial [Gigaspora margarita]
NLINPVEQNFDSVINIPESFSSSIAMPVPGIPDSVINIPEFSLSSIATPVPGISDSVIATPVPGMDFGSWDKIDKYLDAYCHSKNYSKIIYEAEYDSQIQRRCHYQCAISITTVFLEHRNHPFDSLANKFNITNRTFTEAMLADIELWTTKENLNMRIQHQLLEAKYENVFFLPQDLSNAIQRVKAEQRIDDKAATLINYLLECKNEDI